MSVTIIHKKGSGIPSAESLEVAEIAVDIVTGKLYTKTNDGKVVEISGSAESGIYSDQRNTVEEGTFQLVWRDDDPNYDSFTGTIGYARGASGTPNSMEGSFVFAEGVNEETGGQAILSIGRDADLELEGDNAIRGKQGRTEGHTPFIEGFKYVQAGDFLDADGNSIIGAGGGGLDPAIWTDQLANDLAIMASDYVSKNFPIHPLINWTGGFLQIGVWRIGVGPLGFQMIYYDTPEGVVFTDSGVVRVTGEVRGQSDDVIDVVSKQTRSNKFTLGDFIISSVGERLCFYYQDNLKAVIDENGHLNMLGQAIANYGSVVKSVDIRSADHSFGDWFMSADGDKLSFGTDAGVMATIIGDGSFAGIGTVKEDEVLV